MANDRVEIRPAKRQDVKEFYGNKMRDTCRAWSAFYDGKLVAIGGVAITSNIVVVFMEMRIDQEVPKITIWRGTLEIWSKIKDLGYSVLYAVVDPEQKTAPAYLSRLGFEHIRGNIYKWQTQSQQHSP